MADFEINKIHQFLLQFKKRTKNRNKKTKIRDEKKDIEQIFM